MGHLFHLILDHKKKKNQSNPTEDFNHPLKNQAYLHCINSILPQA